MKWVKKFINLVSGDFHNRGVIITIIMYSSYVTALCRALVNKLTFRNNIFCSLFFLQSKSQIEIYNKKAKAVIGKFVFIRKNTSIRLDHGGELYIGEKAFINNNCTINCVNKIVIGKHTKIAPNVSINDHDHNYKNVNAEHLLIGEIIIGENVWIGANAVILRNTTIGDNSVIAAGSIVKGFVKPNTLYLNKREGHEIELGKNAIKKRAN